MIFKVLFWITIALEVVLVPVFIILQWPHKTKISLLVKMVCSSLFIVLALLSMKIADNYSTYAVQILIALSCAWIGDFFLHISEGLFCRITGMLFFFFCHVMYIKSCYGVWKALFPNLVLINISGIFIIEMLIVLVFIYGFIKKWPIGKVLLPLVIYGSTLCLMFAVMCTLGVHIFKLGEEHCKLLAFLLVGGSGIFFISDFLWGIIYTEKRFKNLFLFRWLNLGTYYIAQMMLASTILFLQ